MEEDGTVQPAPPEDVGIEASTDDEPASPIGRGAPARMMLGVLTLALGAVGAFGIGKAIQLAIQNPERYFAPAGSGLREYLDWSRFFALVAELLGFVLVFVVGGIAVIRYRMRAIVG